MKSPLRPSAEIVRLRPDEKYLLKVFHIGGDETPGFAWTESPACDKYMFENDLKITDLFTHFIVKYAGIVNKHGFQVAGWEEAFIYRHVRPLEIGKEISLDHPPIVMPWNSRWDGPNIKWPYYFANEGYRLGIQRLAGIRVKTFRVL